MALPMHILPTIFVPIVNLNDPAMKMFLGFIDHFEFVGNLDWLYFSLLIPVLLISPNTTLDLFSDLSANINSNLNILLGGWRLPVCL